MEDTKGRATDQGGESEEPEEDKFLKFVGKCGQIFVRSIAVIFKKTKDKVTGEEENEAYETYSPDTKQGIAAGGMQKWVTIGFLILGILGGIFIENFTAFQCRKFAAFAAGANLMDDFIIPSVAGLVFTVIIILCYVVYGVLLALAFILTKFFLKNDVPEEIIQNAFVYAIMCSIIISLICMALQGISFRVNLFLFWR